jgi:hypothetical protein
MLRVFVEEGLDGHEQAGQRPRRRAEGPHRLHGELPLKPDQHSNGGLCERLDG